MANTYATELAGQTSTPVDKLLSSTQGATERVFRATITMASQASGDTITLARVPKGYRFSRGVITASATMGAAATIAIGTAASSAKYRAAAVFTAVDTPTMFGKTTGIDAAKLTAEETVIATIAAASLPASGTVVIELVYIKA